MQSAQLISRLLKISDKKAHRALLKKHEKLLDLEFARRLRDTYYDSWTKEPQKTRNAATALAALAQITLPEESREEIKAFALWVGGIADLTEGRLARAVRNLDAAADRLRQLEKEHHAAQTQVAKIIALALLGKYDEAIAAGKRALKIFEKFGDELAAGKIEKNLGNIVARRGNERQAEKYYLAARRRFVKIGNRSELTMNDNSLANTYAELNDFRRAETFYAQALETARAEKMFVTEAEIEASIGNLALFRGNYSEALRYLELSRRKYEALRMPHQTAIAELEIADIYLELNLAAEAFEIYEKIADELKRLKLRGEEARARANFGRAALLLGKPEKARRELKTAARLYQTEGSALGFGSVKIALAGVEIARSDYKSAYKLAVEAELVLSQSTNLRLKSAARQLTGEALANLKKFAEAKEILEPLYRSSLRHEQKNIAQTALNSLGKLFVQTRDNQRAEKHFKKAIKIIENLRAPLAGEEFRMSFLADKLAPFENLARLYIKEKKFGKAFALFEKARARTLSEALDADDARAHRSRETNKKSAGRFQKKLDVLREELNWYYHRLSRADEAAEATELQTEITSREKQIGRLTRQIESTAANRSSAKTDAEFRLKILQRQLGADRALVEFVSFDDSFAAFVVTDKKINFVENLGGETEIVLLLENLHFQFGALRYGAHVSGKFAETLKKRADFYLRALAEKLFDPLEKLCGEKNLVVVPAGALNYVPFQALRLNDRRYLIETREIVYAPSATVWCFLQNKRAPHKKPKNALLIGYADERIPLVEREIETLRKIFAEARSFTGEAATFAAFTENAADFDILHLACHGRFRADNPLFSSLHLADGSVTVRDVYAQKISAELVVLSACETGLNKIFAGDEILGLSRGFLAAGATSLVLSLWTVSDEATAALMKDFYTNLQRGETIAASLRLAQTNFIARGEHPFFWSPFALIGK